MMTLQTSSLSLHQRKKSSSLSGLPWDLVEEILTRVPATSLKRLRFTCKRWNVLFNDKRFTERHYDKAEKQFLLVMLRMYKVCSMSVNLHGLHDNIDPSIEVKSELSLIDPYYNPRISVAQDFHCNGLLLCITKDGLVVWNPCTGLTRWIQTEIYYTRGEKYALGYENNKSCYNYKILKFRDLEDFNLEIYEFKSNSWRIVGNATPDFMVSLNGVSLKGNTYWIASHKKVHELIDDFLISFDFTTERFGPRMCLPFKGRYYQDIVSLSCVREERLSVFFQDKDTLKIEIWMSNNINETNAMSWSQFLKIDLNTHRFETSLSFFIDEENKVIVCCDKEYDDIDKVVNNMVYIIGEDQYWRKVNIGQGLIPLRPRMVSYVPSLVQI